MKTHQQTIEATRVGGFGGSDAKMFYKIGQKGLGALSTTDKKRIAVAKGLQPYKSINKTAAMQKGHDFEDWYAAQSFAPIAEREAKISRDLALNFDIFAHADFYHESEKIVWELKCVQDTDSTESNYYHQLQWYYMLGARRVWLVVCDSTKGFEAGTYFPSIFPKDNHYIETLLHGIKLIDEAWETFGNTEGGEMDESELMIWDKETVLKLANCFTEIKRIEQQADNLKAQILEFMEASGVTSIKSDSYTITYVAPGETATFDKKKLLDEHPEIKESDYLKVSKKKSFIKISLK